MFPQLQADPGAVEGWLHRRGLRATSARRRVMEALAGLQGAFTAEELCRRLPSVGRATVYRTLKLLVEQGVVCKVPLADGTPRYRLGGPYHHHHLVCVACGAVRDLDRCAVEELASRVERGEGFTLLGHRIEFYGLCSRCREGER